MTEQEFRDLKIGDRIWGHSGEVLCYEISEILSDPPDDLYSLDLYYLTKGGNYIFLEDIKEYFMSEKTCTINFIKCILYDCNYNIKYNQEKINKINSKYKNFMNENVEEFI